MARLRHRKMASDALSKTHVQTWTCKLLLRHICSCEPIPTYTHSGHTVNTSLTISPRGAYVDTDMQAISYSVTGCMSEAHVNSISQEGVACAAL